MTTNNYAGPMAVGTGEVVSKAVAAQNYLNPTEISSLDFAARIVAARHRLHIATAREICRLARIGGLA
jgi:hypothetical protein